MKCVIPFLLVVLGACATAEPPDQQPAVVPVAGQPLPPPPPAPPLNVSRAMLEGQRTAGNPNIQLPDSTITRLSNDRVGRVKVGLQVCLDVDGAPMSIILKEASGDAQVDQILRDGVSAWRYRPYVVGGKAIPVCFVVVFNYRIPTGP